MNMSWKLLPLAALFAVVLLSLTPGGASRPAPVHADAPCSGDEVGELRIRFREDGVTETTFEGFSVNIAPEPSNAAHDGSLDIDDEGVGDDQSGDIGQINVDVACQTDHTDMEPYDFTASIIGGSDAEDANCTIEDETINNQDLEGAEGVVLSVNFTVNCEEDEPVVNITINKSAEDDDTEDFDFTIAGPGTDCDDDFTLSDGDEVEYACEFDSDTYTVTEDVPEGWVLTEIDCSGSGDVVVDLDNAEVEITLNDADESVDCIFVNEQIGEPGDPATVVLQGSPATQTCGGFVFLVATVEDADGTRLEDVLVTFTAPVGTISPASVLSSVNGVAQSFLQAPETGGGVITITAQAGSAIDTIQIELTCADAAATATSVPPATIRPPSTGDAGLANGSGWLPYAGIAGLVAAMFGAAFVTARRGS